MDTIQKLETNIISSLENLKAKDIEIIDTSNSTALFDKIIIVSATSNTHARALAHNILKIRFFLNDHKINGKIEGIKNAEWIIVDLNYIIVHIMQIESRAFYKLSDLWKNIP